jgi:NAD(P)-dependent dehydrogenase (short-subunit alcohol dehydrogenase family)
MMRFAYRTSVIYLVSSVFLSVRFAEVSDVVNGIVFLLSDLSAMVNGVTLPIDGGFLAC